MALPHRISKEKPNKVQSENLSEQLHEDAAAGEWLTLIEASLYEALSQRLAELNNSGDPCWSAIYSLLRRLHQHVSGAVSLFYSGHWESLEVLTRAAIEASATIILIAKDNREVRLSQFLTHHFSTMKKRVLNADPSVLEYANKTFNQRVEITKEAFGSVGIGLNSIGWPKTTKDRFSAAGMTLEYAHTYSFLSSNVHGDAEYIVDDIVAACAYELEPSARVIAASEKLYWARYWVYTSLRYYALAVIEYGNAYDLHPVADKAKHVESAIIQKMESNVNTFRESRNTFEQKVTRGKGFG
jgi:hypothetical protein